MNIFFQVRNIDIDQSSKEGMANRMYGLNKFFSPDARAFIDVEKTRASHNGHDLYYVSIHLEDGKDRYFTEDYQENVRKSFDHAYGELFRIVRDDRSKSRSIAKKAGAQLKKIFRRG